jgi:uncharacterized membrane protein
MSNRHDPIHANHKTDNPHSARAYPARAPSETLFSVATFANLLVSLAAFVFALALFVTAHEQFGAGAGAGTVGDGLQYGPCLWMQATRLVVLLLTPVIRIASRVWGERRSERLESSALGRQSIWKV